MLPSIDIEGQQALLDARVLIIGMGGHGSPVGLYLAAAGIGHMVISDFDEVDLSNLQRQIAHTTKHIGQPKVESAKQSFHQINPMIEITAINKKLEGDELLAQVKLADIVVDCCDNFETRFAINRACVEAQPVLPLKRLYSLARQFGLRGKFPSLMPSMQPAHAITASTHVTDRLLKTVQKMASSHPLLASSVVHKRLKPLKYSQVPANPYKAAFYCLMRYQCSGRACSYLAIQIALPAQILNANLLLIKNINITNDISLALL